MEVRRLLFRSDVIAELSPNYPDIGLSFGYIGNIWHGPYQDDRSFRVFTMLRDRFGYSVNFGGHSSARLGELAFLIRAKLADWCAEQRVLLEKGEHRPVQMRSEEHTSELQSLMRNSYAVFCLKKKQIMTACHQHG